VRTISYDFDKIGNLESLSDPTATYVYGYDNLNRGTSLTQTIVGLTPSVSFNRAYDAASRMTSSRATIGTSADYINGHTYDALGRLTTLTQAAQTGGQAVASKRVDLDYNADNQLTAIERYAAVTSASPVAASEFSYDLAGRLSTIEHDATAPGSTFAETHGYSYDDANWLTGYTNLLGSVNATYSYDLRGQLTGADHTGTTFDETYGYDDNGNRASDSSATYTIGPDNRLYSISETGSDYPIVYLYDNEGNRSAKFIDEDFSGHLNSADSIVELFTWDHRNRLTKVEFKNTGHSQVSKSIEYGYDAFNQLVSRKEDTDGAYGTAPIEQTIFVHDGAQVALQFDKTGAGDVAANNLSHRYLRGDAVDQLFADEQVNWSDSDADGEVLWAMTDNLGSVRDVIDSDGKLRIHRRFDAFGNTVDETHYDASGAVVTSGAGYVDEAFAFTGRLLDKDTRLQNNLNRWYDSQVGRWLSEDPISFAAGDANLYRYVNNEPVSWTDPTGLAGGYDWSGEPSVQKSDDGGFFSVPDPGDTEEGGFWHNVKEWWHYFFPHAADAALESVEHLPYSNGLKVPVPVGTALEALEAGEQLTAEAAVLLKHKQYMDLQKKPNVREKDVQKAYQEWHDAQEKLRELQRKSEH
jgi:RHS repeat-associated protein